MKKNFNVEYMAGGATQNSIRVAQWMIGEPQACAFTGCVGKDENAHTLRATAEKAGVEVLYEETDAAPTGTCAVLVVDHERSLCANVAAAEKFTVAHLEHAATKAAIERAKFFYTASFFLLSCPAASLKVAEHANANNKTFIINLAAPFLCEFFLDRLMPVFDRADIVFGNETEARAFAKALKLPELEDVQEITKLVQALPGRKRTVVFTQGALPAWVARPDHPMASYPPIFCPPAELVDVNGAGDAFVGGFLSQLVKGKDIDQCMKAGHWASSIVIRRSGCTYPDVCDFKA